MEVLLILSERFLMAPVYSVLPQPLYSVFEDPSTLLRQGLSLWVITAGGGVLLYFVLSLVAFYTYFDRSLLKHPKIVKNQIRKEIELSMMQIPLGAAMMVPFWLAEVRGLSHVYYDISDHGLPFFIFSFFSFLVFSDFCIYWIHRILHHPLIYAAIHKPHHQWKISTPFSSFAFNPIDGFLQSLPYHVYPFIFPLQAGLHIGLFIFVQIWTIGIHDNTFWTSNSVVNGAAHHTIHHLEFNYNYGQYSTLWDHLFGTHKFPNTKKDVKAYFRKALAIQKTE